MLCILFTVFMIVSSQAGPVFKSPPVQLQLDPVLSAWLGLHQAGLCRGMESLLAFPAQTVPVLHHPRPWTRDGRHQPEEDKRFVHKEQQGESEPLPSRWLLKTPGACLRLQRQVPLHPVRGGEGVRSMEDSLARGRF